MIQALRTTTATVLLEGLLDCANKEAWREFDARYRPIIIGFARKLGLGDEDAADAAQETLVRFLIGYRDGQYDRRRGRLRSWLIGIVRCCVADLKRARVARRERRGISAIADLPDDNQLTAIWDREHRGAILRQAVAELRDSTRLNDRTIRAFELYALKQQPAEQVARGLGLTLHDVYMAKNRVAERLRAILTRLDEFVYDD